VLDQSIEALSTKVLFPEKPTIKFLPDIKKCPCCYHPLKVRNTETKRIVYSLHIGAIRVHRSFLHCKNCDNPTIHTSEDILTLVPKHCNFGYDVMVYIGKALFVYHQTINEIINSLALRNIPISSSQVSYLGQKFIVYLAIAHRESNPKIKECMNKNGGYILHVDGTCEGTSPHLISVLDEISQFVLGNIKIATENAPQIIPLLKEMKNNYGMPLVVVSDMGRALLGAVAETFPGIAHFICHFHFLRDIGKDLFNKEYTLIRKKLQKHGIAGKLRYRLRQFEKNEEMPVDFHQLSHLTLSNQFPGKLDASQFKAICYVLIIWALDGKKQGVGLGFPFDRPHVVFYQRLNIVNNSIKKLRQSHTAAHYPDIKPILQLSNDLQSVIEDIDCKEVFPVIVKKIQVFDKLRKAMRITLPQSNEGLNDNGQQTDIKSIEQKVKQFGNWLVNSKIYYGNENYKKMIGQINKYWEKLFADPINVETPTGIVQIQPQRTNNILEHFFRDFRRNFRRKTGNNNMSKMLQTMIADTPLVKNLQNPKYMKLLLNDKSTLEERFAEIDDKIVRYELNKAKQKQEKIPVQIKKIIKSEKTMKLFLNLF